MQRGKDICERNDFYHCLYDTNTKSWREKCFKPDDLPPGKLSKTLHLLSHGWSLNSNMLGYYIANISGDFLNIR